MSRRISEELRTPRHQGQDAIFPFLAQVLLDAANVGDPAHQGLRLMDVEVVRDEVPACERGSAGDEVLHMGQEIFCGACGTTKGGDKLSRHHVATEKKATGAMT